MFTKGTSGNPAGRPLKNDTPRRLRRLMAKDAPTIVGKVIEMALAGDMTAAKILVERLCPAIKPIELPVYLALNPNDDLVTQGRSVLAGLVDGSLAPGQASTLLQTLGALGRLIEIETLEKRITALEEKP